jgi:hypothetical protein
MNYFIVSGAFFVSLLTTFLFLFLYKNKANIKDPVLFFLIIFFASWSSQLWISPFGPDLWGVSWVPMLITALIAAILSIAIYALPVSIQIKANNVKSNGGIISQRTPLEITGLLIWILLLVLIASVVFAYSKGSITYIL